LILPLTFIVSEEKTAILRRYSTNGARMYLHHPLDVDEFDFDEFERENVDTLKDLYAVIKDLFPGMVNDTSIMEQRAGLLTMAVFSKVESLENNTEFIMDESEELDDLQNKFFQLAILLCIFYSYEEMGVMERRKNGYTFTKEGKKHIDREVKKVKLMRDEP